MQPQAVMLTSMKKYENHENHENYENHESHAASGLPQSSPPVASQIHHGAEVK